MKLTIIGGVGEWDVREQESDILFADVTIPVEVEHLKDEFFVLFNIIRKQPQCPHHELIKLQVCVFVSIKYRK